MSRECPGSVPGVSGDPGAAERGQQRLKKGKLYEAGGGRPGFNENKKKQNAPAVVLKKVHDSLVSTVNVVRAQRAFESITH